MVDKTVLIIALIAIGVFILIHIAFTAFCTMFCYKMLRRIEGITQHITENQFETLNDVCQSYKGVCETYHDAQEIIKSYFTEFNDGWRKQIFPPKNPLKKDKIELPTDK